ncbi:hypothetical protein GCM10023170_049250 [Phytohabitans houttuyneae]|uniref:Uncharacterized protein n=1 Tax=Phytohabitans houttuyneae TaxID=1076126 RepID=A0A6V8KR41_9ACTN|nr:hypothetical protein Phou_084470 [Phytohabitans houttuyneae]
MTGTPRAVSTAHEPDPYGYAGEGTVPDRRLEDLEDTAENISVPVDDLTEDADGPEEEL